ncbi:MAG: glycosyltransferase [Verrucomicrobiota bacterium]|nr:glycosyltransferase [Verrucomicrobiota bacterium]
MKLSILIPAYNEEILIKRTLESIKKTLYDLKFYSFEIIVCDNNSDDATTEIVESSGARVVKEKYNQISKARNTAAKAALGEWFIFIDADTLPTKDLLSQTLENLKSGKICGGGATVSFDNASPSLFLTLLLMLWNTVSCTLKLAAGSYIYCLREVWEETGGFSEKVYAGEELLFSREMKKWGKKHNKNFKIIKGCPVRTSDRKMKWFTLKTHLKQVLILFLPGSFAKRKNCFFWYSRPK